MIVKRGAPAASMSRRAIAVVVDFALFITPVIGISGVLAWRRPGTSAPVMSTRVVRVGNGALQGALVVLRNWHTPGQRLTGVRRVDARTGGDVSLHSAIALRLIDLAWPHLTRPVARRLTGDFSSQVEPSQSRLQQIRETHAGDPARIAEESAAIGRERAEGCLRPMIINFGASIAMPTAVALRSPRRQTVRDRLSGTVVVRVSRN